MTLEKIEGNTTPCRESLKNIGAVEVEGVLMIEADSLAAAHAMVAYAAAGKMTANDKLANRKPIKTRPVTQADRWREWQTGGMA